MFFINEHVVYTYTCTITLFTCARASSLSMEFVDRSLIEYLRYQGKTYTQISEQLKILYPTITMGLSSRSVCRYCYIQSIGKLTEDEIDEVVHEAVNEVGILNIPES